jgi:ATP-dependent helicase HrpA
MQKRNERLAPMRKIRPPLPAFEFPASLPVSEQREKIGHAIATAPVVIVCGETGSGKTTQLPKIAWNAGCGRAGLIGHTQPRRLAATAVAKRIAQELGSPLGEHVGYKIRFNEQLTASATIKLMTDGVLLAETLSDPTLDAYDTIIIDEAHERSLNIDFLLGYLKQLIEGPRKGTLKIIITSATIDATRFAEHFANDGVPAPVIEVSGRLFPVELRYRPLGAQTDEDEAENDEVEQSLPGAIADAAIELWREGPGDILVFLPGEREIRDTMEDLRKAHQRSSLCRGTLEILPLYSRLSAADQEKVFSASSGWRMVLATNVAETSLTVPGVRYVIDAGLARVKRYRYRNKVEQLQVERISQAAANQRSGRCGRVASGICIRLYDEIDYQKRPRFTDPEILRSSLAAVILRMKALRLVEIDEFGFIDAPPRRAILDGFALLQELQALDDDRELTEIGKQLSRLPLDPRIARMLLEAKQQGALAELLIIAAALSVQDPRERPMQAAAAADQKHVRFSDERSDFLGWLKLWQYWGQQREGKSSNRLLAEQLKKEFLSPRRLREWQDVLQQLTDAVVEAKWIADRNAAQLTALTFPLDNSRYEKIHRSLLAGLLGNLGLKSTESTVFQGTHEVKFMVHPGSGLARKAGRWIMAGELVETTRLYARQVAQINPDWIEKAAPHLIKRSCADPRWEKHAAQVIALEKGVLYGLPIYSQRRVHYGARDPKLARELLILGALVNFEWDAKIAFMDHNRRLVSDIESLEHKIRRPDLLIDEQLLFQFFDARVPDNIVTGLALEQWWHKQPDKKALFLSRADLMRKSVDGISTDKFPATFACRGMAVPLHYHFEPGSPKDGVTATVPLFQLNQIDARLADWLVPGMRKDKVLALIKSLPPKIRHRLQPLDAFAQRFADEFEQPSDRSLLDELRDAIKLQVQLPVLPGDFRFEAVAPHCFMRFAVLDEHGRELAASRDLAALRQQLGQQAQQHFRAATEEAVPSGNTASKQTMPKQSTSWDFGPINDLIELPDAQGQVLIGYPALVAKDNAVALQVFDDPLQAARVHKAGLNKLFALQFKEQIKFFDRQLPGLRDMSMHYISLGSIDELRTQLIELTLERACMSEPWPTDQAAFEARVAAARPRFGLIAQEVGRLAGTLLEAYAHLHKRLPTVRSHGAAFKDIETQLNALVGKWFLRQLPWDALSHLPRYLKAMALRIDRLKSDPARDQSLMTQMSPLMQRWLRYCSDRQRDFPGQSLTPKAQEMRWLMEELRVSLWAQELRTPMPVSVKRLEKVWAALIME